MQIQSAEWHTGKSMGIAKHDKCFADQMKNEGISQLNVRRKCADGRDS